MTTEDLRRGNTARAAELAERATARGARLLFMVGVGGEQGRQMVVLLPTGNNPDLWQLADAMEEAAAMIRLGRVVP